MIKSLQSGFCKHFEMTSKFLLVLLVLAFCSCVNAKLNFSNLQGQKDFLNSLLKEVEKYNTKESAQKGADPKDGEDAEQRELEKYKKDIKTLKKTLYSIEDENSKKESNNKVLQDLVDDYNKKMQELEKTYKFIMSKSKNAGAKDEYLSPKSHEVLTMDSLNSNKKSRKIKDSAFKPLELVEFRNDATASDRPATPLENR